MFANNKKQYQTIHIFRVQFLRGESTIQVTYILHYILYYESVNLFMELYEAQLDQPKISHVALISSTGQGGGGSFKDRKPEER